MAHYNINVEDCVYESIRSYYINVSKKYCSVYSYENMDKDIKDVVSSINLIENGLLRRKPKRDDWKDNGWFMAHARVKTKIWYFAYTIEGNTIHVMDACHGNNMATANMEGQKKQDEALKRLYIHLITERVIQKIRQLG